MKNSALNAPIKLGSNLHKHIIMCLSSYILLILKNFLQADFFWAMLVVQTNYEGMKRCLSNK